MAENSRIEWTDHTFNPWWGCTKVSHGCTNCYADAQDHDGDGDVWAAMLAAAPAKPGTVT